MTEAPTVAPVLEGIPQARLSEPFPASNPLVLPKGNSLQQYTNPGDAATWYTPNLRTGVNDRINFSIQRELPCFSYPPRPGSDRTTRAIGAISGGMTNREPGRTTHYPTLIRY